MFMFHNNIHGEDAEADEEKFGGGWKFCPQGYMHYDTNIFPLR